MDRWKALITIPILNSNSSTPIRVRVAEVADAERIATMINLAFRPVEGWFVTGARIKVEGVKQLLVTGTLLLAENDLGLLGCVYVEPQIHDQAPGRSYLGLLSVDPARQQLGVGSVLMTAGEDFCRQRGSKAIEIKVVNLREELFGFYRRRGYVETGTAPFPPELATKQPCHFVTMSKQLHATHSTQSGTL